MTGNDQAIGTILPPAPGRPYATVLGMGDRDLPALSADSIETLLKAHGAVLVRGYRSDIDAFRRFSDPFCASWVINEAKNRDILDSEHNVQSVDRGTEAFALHSEISRSPWRPDICFFFCVEPPAAGGETTLCDGIALAAALPEEIRAALLRQRFVYLRAMPPAALAYWLGTATPGPEQLAHPPADCPFRFVRKDGRILSVFTRPALHKPLFSDARAFANFLLFARDMHHNTDFPLLANGRRVPDEWVDAIRHASQQLTAAIAWERGDLLLLDNSRFMHGRARVIDPANRIIASRFGYLRSAPASEGDPPDPVWRRRSFAPPGDGQARGMTDPAGPQ